MKKHVKPEIFLPLCAALLALASCSELPEELPANPSASGSVRFSFETPAAMLTVRSMDPARETEVRDVNLWLMNSMPGAARHRYLSGSGNLTLELPAGTYDYYALANAGTDLGERDAASLEEISLSLDPYTDFQEGGRLPMAGRGSFTVSGFTTVAVRLVRCAAKVELDLSVAPAFAQEFTLTRVQALDVPTRLRPFGDNRPEDLAATADYPAEEAADGFHGVYYLPESLAGTNTAISDPQQRSRANAPKGAACFRIEGTAQGRKVDYFVYPGANTTSDFNLRRNRHYRIEALITGINTLDTRVSTTEVDLPAWNDRYFTGATARSLLTLSCMNNADNRFDLSYELLSGSGTVEIDGQPLSPGVPFRLLEGGSNRSAEIAYTQQEEGEAALRLTLKDRYGFTIERELSTSFVKDGPRVTFEQEGDTLYGYEFGFLDLHIFQPGYTGSYRVTVAGSSCIYYEYDSDTPVTDFTLPGNGDYTLGVNPARLGPNPFRITVTDSEGRSAQITSVVVGRTADVQVRSGYTGGGLDRLTIYVGSSCPVGEDLEVTVAAYLAKLTMGGRETETEWMEMTLTIPRWQTEASEILIPPGNYVGYVVKGGVWIRSLSVVNSRDGLYRYENVTP